MIELTRLNGSVITVNAHMIETVESLPDTVVTLNTERKFIVKESSVEITQKVIEYNKKIFQVKTSSA